MTLSWTTIVRRPELLAQPSISFLSFLFFCISLAVVGLHAWQIQQITSFDSNSWHFYYFDKDKTEAGYYLHLGKAKTGPHNVWKYLTLMAPRFDTSPHMLAISAGILNIIFILIVYGVIRHFTPRASVCLDCSKEYCRKTSRNAWMEGTVFILWIAICFLAAAAYIQTLIVHVGGARINEKQLWSAVELEILSNGTVYPDRQVFNLERWSCSIVQDIWSVPVRLTDKDFDRGWTTCMVSMAGRYTLSLLCVFLVPFPLMAWFTLRRLPKWRQRSLTSTR